MSEGAVWIPGNHLMGDAEIPDSFEDAITYLRAITNGAVDEERLSA